MFSFDLLGSKQRALGIIQHSAIVRVVLLLAGWLGVWLIAGFVEYTHHASVWFPPAGLTFATLFVVGIRAAPVLMLAAVLVTIFTGNDYHLQLQNTELIKSGVMFGIAHITPYYLGSKVFRWLTDAKKLSLPTVIISFLLIVATAALAATFLVITSLSLSGMMSFADVSATWLPFWIGDMAGIIILSPLFFSCIQLAYPHKCFTILKHIEGQSNQPTAQFKYKILLSSCLIIVTMLLTKFTQSMDSSFAIFFLVLPHMWIACTETAFPNILSLALSSIFIVFLIDLLALMDFVMVYQYTINVVAANAMFAMAIPALIAHNHQLVTRVSTDSLTQAASREHLIEQGKFELQQAIQHNRDFSILVYDIDYFKNINDTYGHDVGDAALKMLSEIAKALLRPTDLLGRLGGDEFVVLLPNTDKATACNIANRLLEHVNGTEFVSGEAFSASIGITQMREGDDFNSIFKRADNALYAAKKAGRNCIRLN